MRGAGPPPPFPQTLEQHSWVAEAGLKGEGGGVVALWPAPSEVITPAETRRS